MFFHNTIQEHSLVATGIPWHNRFVRDWYTGCAQPSQGCETSSTLVSRFETISNQQTAFDSAKDFDVSHKPQSSPNQIVFVPAIVC